MHAWHHEQVSKKIQSPTPIARRRSALAPKIPAGKKPTESGKYPKYVQLNFAILYPWRPVLNINMNRNRTRRPYAASKVNIRRTTALGEYPVRVRGMVHPESASEREYIIPCPGCGSLHMYLQYITAKQRVGLVLSCTVLHHMTGRYYCLHRRNSEKDKDPKVRILKSVF